MNRKPRKAPGAPKSADIDVGLTGDQAAMSPGLSAKSEGKAKMGENGAYWVCGYGLAESHGEPPKIISLSQPAKVLGTALAAPDSAKSEL